VRLPREGVPKRGWVLLMPVEVGEEAGVEKEEEG
jgi:hypothetical protein